MTETLHFTSPLELPEAAAWFEEGGSIPSLSPSEASQVPLRAGLTATAPCRIKQGLKSAPCDNSSP